MSGDALTVTSRSAPNADSFVQWSGGDRNTGLIFWVNSQNIQDKASWNAGALPGIGYMKFSIDAIPPFEPGEDPEEKVGYLEITKYDGTTNLPLGGAVFQVEEITPPPLLPPFRQGGNGGHPRRFLRIHRIDLAGLSPVSWNPAGIPALKPPPSPAMSWTAPPRLSR